MSPIMQLSPLQIALSVLLVYVAYSLVGVVRQANRPGLKDVPGPFIARYTNLVLKWYVIIGRRMFYIHALHEKYGPAVRIAPNEVSFTDRAAVRTIYHIKDDFNKAEWYHILTSQPRRGIFAQSGKATHSVRRKLYAPAFAKTSIYQWEPQFKEKVDIAIEKIKRDASVGNADIFKWFTYMTTDIIGDLAFGESFDILSHEKKPQYVNDLETSMLIGGVRAEFQWLLPLISRLPIAALHHALAVFERTRSYGHIAVRNAKSVSTNKTTIFGKMIEEGENGEPVPEFHIADEAGNLMIAGSGTTAVSLTYMVWCILRHPHVRDNLLAELKLCPAQPLAKDLEKLPYLNAVIDETLRLYAAAPATMPRIVPASTPSLGGYVLPAGTIVGTQAYSVHRDAKAFPNPLVFDPTRWLDPTPLMQEHWIPWGGGARICLGIHLARLEMQHAVYGLLMACPDLKLAATTTDASMAEEEHFLINPVSHKCEVTLL